MRSAASYICGLDAAVDLIVGKWKPLILWELQAGVRRFGELRQSLPGISQKMLTQQLRELEADQLVRREVFPEVPPRVEYSLTPFGASLNRALASLGDWGHDNMDRIVAVRARAAVVDVEAASPSSTSVPRPADPTP